MIIPGNKKVRLQKEKAKGKIVQNMAAMMIILLQ